MGSVLQNASRGVYTNVPAVEIGGMFPVWQDDRKTFRKMGVITALSNKFGKGSTKVSDIYPEAMRAGTMFTELPNKQGMPIPVYKILNEIGAEETNVVILQGFGLPKLVQGTKVKTVTGAAEEKEITVGAITTDENGNAKITITANDLGELPKGSYLILSDAAEYIPMGLTNDTKTYIGLDVANTSIDNVIVDGGRIRRGLFAGLPESIRIKYLQTIKVD